VPQLLDVSNLLAISFKGSLHRRNFYGVDVLDAKTCTGVALVHILSKETDDALHFFLVSKAGVSKFLKFDLSHELSTYALKL
jgi:hypothetical protein